MPSELVHVAEIRSWLLRVYAQGLLELLYETQRWSGYNIGGKSFYHTNYPSLVVRPLVTYGFGYSDVARAACEQGLQD
jgi:hypothetical protein